MARARSRQSSILVPVSLLLCLVIFESVGSVSVAAQSNTVQVSIVSTTTYSPAVVTVVIGINNTVVWTNNDNVVHTVTGTNLTGFNSGNISPGATYSYTFDTPGVYPYKCLIHPTMTGTVIVKGSAVSAASTPSSSGGGIPEFSYQIFAVGIFTLLIVVSYLFVKRNGRPSWPGARKDSQYTH